MHVNLFGRHPVENGILPNDRRLGRDQLVEQGVREDGRQLKHLQCTTSICQA